MVGTTSYRKRRFFSNCLASGLAALVALCASTAAAQAVDVTCDLVPNTGPRFPASAAAMIRTCSESSNSEAEASEYIRVQPAVKGAGRTVFDDDVDYVVFNGFLEGFNSDVWEVTVPLGRDGAPSSRNLVLYFLEPDVRVQDFSDGSDGNPVSPEAQQGPNTQYGQGLIRFRDNNNNNLPLGTDFADALLSSSPEGGLEGECSYCWFRASGIDPNTGAPSVVINYALRDSGVGATGETVRIEIRSNAGTLGVPSFGEYSFRLSLDRPMEQALEVGGFTDDPSAFIPLPPAVWAMGAALAAFGLIGIRRRRAAAA